MKSAIRSIRFEERGNVSPRKAVFFFKEIRLSHWGGRGKISQCTKSDA